MKKIFPLLMLAILVITATSSCLKTTDAIENLKKSCLYDAKKDYFNKWANVYTTIQTSDTVGVITQNTIFPVGYFQLSADGTYSRMSNNVPLSGKWDVTDSCKLVLDPGNNLKREFEVVKLTADSLTLRRKEGKKVYIQHYAAFHCFDLTQIIHRWDNTVIEQQTYNGENVYPSYTIYPNGNFTLNSDYTYTRLSNNDYLEGKWLVNSNCQLVLDKGTNLERSFDIQKLTADSLIIWRKDTLAHANYLQKYIKH
jgi:hypothetical protein